MKNITRRQFGKSVAAMAAIAAIPKIAFGQIQPASLAFPKGFLWGCATAAYQVEGAAAEDGRGPSIWDTFSHTPGKTYNGETGDVADDTYHLYKEDIRLLRNLGVGTYRMSSPGPASSPNGKGRPNPKGMDYYNRVVDELLANHITPYITLFHWDLPQALPGGWQSRDTSKAFADYAPMSPSGLGDRVNHFMTTNEFTCFTDLGYRVGQFAPGLKLPTAKPTRCATTGFWRMGWRYRRFAPIRRGNPGRPGGKRQRFCSRHRNSGAH